MLLKQVSCKRVLACVMWLVEGSLSAALPSNQSKLEAHLFQLLLDVQLTRPDEKSQT